MDAESPRARDVIHGWAAKGRYHFRMSDMRAALGVSAAATKLALNRLARKGLIASPARGFYVIVPPEYMRIRCLPAAQFIPALMECKKRPYYVSLLSAAQYHGAAHHRPQVFQVTLDRNRRPISCGAVRVLFYARKRIAEVPVQKYNTPRGTMLVSSAEATAVDLVGYERRVGGLDNVATVLSELAEIIDPRLLADAAKTAPLAWGQRLGYILEQVGAADKTAMLKAHVKERAHDLVPLAPGMPFDLAKRAADWRLRINTEIEAEV